jgi:hypothetical protein
MEFERCMLSMKLSLKQTLEIAESAADPKTKLQAHAIAIDIYKNVMDLTTNGVIVNDALRIIQSKVNILNGVDIPKSDEIITEDELNGEAKEEGKTTRPLSIMSGSKPSPHFIVQQQQQQYHQLRFDYKFGLEGPYPIYSQEQIDEAINSREFPREMMLNFVGTVGNVFSQSAIDRAIELGSKYDGINRQAKHSLGCDPGFSSSSFGLVCLEYLDGIIKCVYADEFPRSSFNGMVQKIWEIRNLVGTLTNTLIDSANVEFIEAVKMELGEDSNWQRIHDKISWCKKLGLNICDYI